MENESGLDLKIVNVYSLKFPSRCELKNSKENECSKSGDAKSIPQCGIIISADKTALQSGKTKDFPQDDANVNIINLMSSPATEDISSKQSIIASKESIGGIKDSNIVDNKRLEMTRQHQAVQNLYDTIKERRKSALKAKCDPSLKLQKKRKVASESDDEEPRCRKIKSPLDKRDQLRELGCLVVLEDVEEDLAGRTKIMCRHWVRRCEKCKRSCRQKYVNALYRKSAKQFKSGEEGVAQNRLSSKQR
ncbi:hypothetical protein FSP39_013748 [Pinctada imbricata]|uniref:Uncharacterized protein n=1 Tax=Pinctada imbricata TaxID=66713 RepID=A0AA88YIE8_PINIB|nr:hypothetical protein FSP39_013748 [Pinctada imbricata]